VAVRAGLLLLLAACSASEPTLAPVIDVPAVGTAAYPYADIDTLELSVAVAGADSSLSSRAFTHGQALELSGVSFGNDLVIHLSGVAGGVEIAYGRSCAFNLTADSQPLVAPHVYFSRIVKWATGATPAAAARTHGLAYTAPDGSAVIAGGDAAETSVERFDPTSGAFVTAAAQSPARTGSVLAPLADGSALRIGGAVGGVPVTFFELLAPLANGVQEQSLTDARVQLVGHAAATLVDGTVVVIGGQTPGTDGTLTATGATWSFTVQAGTPVLPTLLSATLAVPRSEHTLTRLGDDVGAPVLVVGGRDANGAPVATAELYEPLREAYATFGPSMVKPRYGHQAVRLPDGSVMIVGGRDASGALVDTVEIYSPSVGQFTAAAIMPAGAGLVDMTLTPLPDGRVLIAGGTDAAGDAVTTTLIARLDPIDGTVDLSPTDSLATARAGHVAAALCDGTILLVGGTSAAGAPPSERYNPPSAGRR
jgi:hypothetical protein